MHFDSSFMMIGTSNMNVPTITVFVEFTLLAIIVNYFELMNAHNCQTTITKDSITEDCSYRGLRIHVPQDLNPDVTEINLSGNIMVDLASLSVFDKYTKMKILIMRNMRKASHFSKNAQMFKNLYALEYLDLSNMTDEDSTLDFTWPPNVRILNCSDNPLYHTLHVENLKRLEKLYASGNSVEKFPSFHELARLTVIDLKNNPLKDLSSNILSIHCYLEHLNVTPAMNAMSYCDCRKVRSWMVNHRIKASTPLPCGKPDPPPKCDLRATQTEQDNRRICLGKGLSQNTSSNWYKILPLVLIITFSLLIPSYLYAKKIRDKQHKLHHPKTPKSSPTPVSKELPVDEEENNEDDA